MFVQFNTGGLATTGVTFGHRSRHREPKTKITLPAGLPDYEFARQVRLFVKDNGRRLRGEEAAHAARHVGPSEDSQRARGKVKAIARAERRKANAIRRAKEQEQARAAEARAKAKDAERQAQMGGEPTWDPYEAYGPGATGSRGWDA